ncbi:hypothetical protein WAE56_12820 [Iodobacter sp. LRB]|uniref:hypothetical protein n=1 Tax=unclassified Iodobacter TaxID=235634 RepID=UPI0026D09512
MNKPIIAPAALVLFGYRVVGIVNQSLRLDTLAAVAGDARRIFCSDVALEMGRAGV